MLPAVAVLIHILEHGLLTLIGYIFHNALLAGQLVEIAVHSGRIRAGTLFLQMLQNIGGTDCVLAVVDEVIQNQLACFGIIPVTSCHEKATHPFYVFFIVTYFHAGCKARSRRGKIGYKHKKLCEIWQK